MDSTKQYCPLKPFDLQSAHARYFFPPTAHSPPGFYNKSKVFAKLKRQRRDIMVGSKYDMIFSGAFGEDGKGLDFSAPECVVIYNAKK